MILPNPVDNRGEQSQHPLDPSIISCLCGVRRLFRNSGRHSQTAELQSVTWMLNHTYTYAVENCMSPSYFRPFGSVSDIPPRRLLISPYPPALHWIRQIGLLHGENLLCNKRHLIAARTSHYSGDTRGSTTIRTLIRWFWLTFEPTYKGTGQSRHSRVRKGTIYKPMNGLPLSEYRTSRTRYSAI